MEDYRGYRIDYNLYNQNEYSVRYNGEDVLFDTVNDAMMFIDFVSN